MEPHLTLLVSSLLVAAGGGLAECDTLYSSEAAAGDLFGRSAAASGSTVMIGGHQLGNGGPGLLRVFERNGDDWYEMQGLLPADVSAGDQFGGSVDMDGDRAVIGARLHSNLGTWVGAAYVYERQGMSWQQVAKLQASDADVKDYFGYSSAVDGDRVIAGAYGNDGGGNLTGSAYIFEFDGLAWTEVALVTPPNARSVFFGREVDIDGDIAVVGAYGDGAGSAYVYERIAGEWAQTAKLVPDSGQVGDQFGWSVAVDDDRILCGAPMAAGGGASSGAVYVFEKAGGAWAQTSKLFASSGTTGDSFGWIVELSADELLVGAPSANGAQTGSGAAYSFGFDGVTWTETATLVHSQGVTGDYFGNAVAMTPGLQVVTASKESAFGIDAGAALVYCEPSPPAVLEGSPGAVSLSAGGDHDLDIDFGPALGGGFYWVLGSASGTSPGLELFDTPIPLNGDAYFVQTLTDPLAPFFEGYVGFLAFDGTRTATLQVPAGVDPSLAGVRLDHAVIVSLDLVGLAAVSNPTSVVLVP